MNPLATHEPEWRPVVGYEGRYSVSSDGQVRSESRVIMRSNGRPLSTSERILSAPPLKNGYRAVVLSGGGTGASSTVHTLVAQAFHGPRPFPKAEVRHLDGDPLNNRAENLAWGTHAENIQDSIRHGTNFEAAKTHCLHGHELNEENTYVRGSHRHCRPCHRRREGARRAQKQAQQEVS